MGYTSATDSKTEEVYISEFTHSWFLLVQRSAKIWLLEQKT